MLTYLIKTIVCSAIFWLLYKVAFERERMFRFNRLYLPMAPVTALFIPLVQIPAVVPAIPVSVAVPLETIAPMAGDTEAITVTNQAGSTFPLTTLLVGIWAVVATILFVRFVLNLRGLSRTVRRGRVSDLGDARMVSVNADSLPRSTPYTFMKWIFIPGDTMPEKEVLAHEMAHVRGRHSVDKLLFELLGIIFWFNPVLVLYRRSIDLNHEYLADEVVLKQYHDMARYQTLLIRFSDNNTLWGFTNNFNQFPITKKRLIMMTKQASRGKALLKQSTVIPLCVLAVMLFGNRATAGGETLPVETQIMQAPDQTQQSPGTGATQAQLDEYKKLVDKRSSIKWINGTTPEGLKFTQTDMNRAKELWYIMSADQQGEQKWIVVRAKPFEIKHPAKEEFDSWKDEKEHGVWLNGVRIANSELSKYSPADIGHYMTSLLTRTAKNYGKHAFQTNIYTVDWIKKHNEDLKANDAHYMLPQVVRRQAIETGTTDRAGRE